MEYETTGIPIDAVVSSQLLVNIFEDKTPLHDGAVIIRDDRIVSATSYLPMSASKDIGKQYGTRHRAAKGVSEVTDAFTIVVSEETGRISVTYMGDFFSNISEADLKNQLIEIQENDVSDITVWKRMRDWFLSPGKEDDSNEERDAKNSKNS